MARYILQAPTVEPIHLDEAKLHLRVDTSDDDALIRRLIAACREQMERDTGLALVARKCKRTLDDFPATRLYLAPAPLIDVASITYVDSEGNANTLSTSTYEMETASRPGSVRLAYGQTWPSARGHDEDVAVTYYAGMLVPVSVDATADTLTTDIYAFTDGDQVRVRVSGGADAAAPGGLSEHADYYVVNASGSTVQLSASAGGSAIDITDTGTGQVFLVPQGVDEAEVELAGAAIKLLIGHYYEHREAVMEGKPVEVPLGYRRLVDSMRVFLPPDE